jgi:hypothetical protein
LREQLRTILLQWDGLLEQTPKHARAGLLEKLAVTPSRDSATLPTHFYAALTRETRR